MLLLRLPLLVLSSAALASSSRPCSPDPTPPSRCEVCVRYQNPYLIEVSETIQWDKVAVHCLYNKSGCQWQGNLSECITHGTACAYGNSPVVCNRSGTQIVHCQVQEHAQRVQPQTQQVDSSLTQSSAATTQTVTQDPSAVSSVAPAAVPPVTTAGA